MYRSISFYLVQSFVCPRTVFWVTLLRLKWWKLPVLNIHVQSSYYLMKITNENWTVKYQIKASPITFDSFLIQWQSTWYLIHYKLWIQYLCYSRIEESNDLPTAPAAGTSHQLCQGAWVRVSSRERTLGGEQDPATTTPTGENPGRDFGTEAVYRSRDQELSEASRTGSHRDDWNFLAAWKPGEGN